MTSPPVFACKRCGKEHPATERDDRPGASSEERVKLRTNWDLAEALLAKKIAEKVGDWLDPEIESYERKREKTEMAYFSSFGGTGVWKLPNTITTSKGSEGFFLHCVTCP